MTMHRNRANLAANQWHSSADCSLQPYTHRETALHAYAGLPKAKAHQYCSSSYHLAATKDSCFQWCWNRWRCVEWRES